MTDEEAQQLARSYCEKRANKNWMVDDVTRWATENLHPASWFTPGREGHLQDYADALSQQSHDKVMAENNNNPQAHNKSWLNNPWTAVAAVGIPTIGGIALYEALRKKHSNEQESLDDYI